MHPRRQATGARCPTGHSTARLRPLLLHQIGPLFVDRIHHVGTHLEHLALQCFFKGQFLLLGSHCFGKLLLTLLFLLLTFPFHRSTFLIEFGIDLHAQVILIQIILVTDPDDIVETSKGIDQKRRLVRFFPSGLPDDHIFEARPGKSVFHRIGTGRVVVLVLTGIGQHKIPVGLGARQLPIVLFVARLDLDRLDVLDFEKLLIQPFGRVGIGIGKSLANQEYPVLAIDLHVASHFAHARPPAKRTRPVFHPLIGLAQVKGPQCLVVFPFEEERFLHLPLLSLRFFPLPRGQQVQAAILGLTDLDILHDFQAPDHSQQVGDLVSICWIAIPLGHRPPFLPPLQIDTAFVTCDLDLDHLIDRKFHKQFLPVSDTLHLLHLA